MAERAYLSIQVWQWNGRDDLFTVCTDTHSGFGTRIAGPKMLPGQATLIHEFHLDEDDVQVIVDDYELAKEEADG